MKTVGISKAALIFLGAINMPLILKLVGLCLTLAVVETLHGIIRNGIIAPRIGTKRAKRWSIVTGSLLAFVVCYVWVPALGIQQILPLLFIGLLLAGFMSLFDLLLARYVFHFKWRVIWKDFDPRQGNYLSIGLILLIFMPAIAMQVQASP